MASSVDNFFLGAAGLGDLAVQVATFGGYTTHFAADEYASQVAAGGETDSKKLDAMTDTAAKAAAAKKAATQATDAGAIAEAAKKTADQVASGAVAAVKKFGGLLPWAIGAAALIAGAVLVVELAPAKKAVGA
jgi:hypothetical protein